MKEHKKDYEYLRGDLRANLQILTRSLDGAVRIMSEGQKRRLFSKKSKHPDLERLLCTAHSNVYRIAYDFDEFISLLEAYPKTVSDYLLEQERLKLLEPKAYKAMARKGVIELDENGEPKDWRRGVVHVYWSELKRLMKEEYGVEWKSPAEKNPQIRYD